MRLVIRPGEARALDVNEYGPAQRILHVQHAMQGGDLQAPRRLTKERQWRLLEVDQELADWIRDHAHAIGAVPPFSVPRKPTRRWTHERVYETWREACDDAGVERCGPYCGTKHATLSHLVRHGASLYEAKP